MIPVDIYHSIVYPVSIFGRRLSPIRAAGRGERLSAHYSPQTIETGKGSRQQALMVPILGWGSMSRVRLARTLTLATISVWPAS